ncbi:MAG: hypothetical protein ACREMX_11655 [Gemmatimonadales bacterium]
MNARPSRPPAWAVLQRALTERRPVRVRYPGNERILCPPALGWKNGRPKVLAYQAGGATSQGPLPDDPQQRWRSMFIDEVEDAMIAEGLWAWETADNYSPTSNCIDELDIAIGD